VPVRNVAVSITSSVYIEAVSSVEREPVSAGARIWSR
jgi:hypothetical protein